MEDEKVLICKLSREALDNKIHIYDGSIKNGVCEKNELFTIMPTDIRRAINDKKLMAQLGENILIRLAAFHDIEL